MRALTPTETTGLDQASPIVWTSKSQDPGLIFDIKPGETGFVCFFLMTRKGDAAPKLSFDQGSGFNELTAINLKPFPFGFYHIALDTMPQVARIRFRPCIGPTPFRFLALRTHQAVLVAICHYLFNLRYQKIGIVAPDQKGRTDRIAVFKSNIARIVKFFRDVSAGSGVKSQQGTKEVLPALKLFLSLQARPVQEEMAAQSAQNGDDEVLISFVSPMYNTSAAYLSDLVQSFAMQDARYAELILSDDGSTQKAALARIKEAANEPGVTAIFNEKNRGIASATNAGIAAAKGEWIAFIDHDDQFVPGAIAIIAKAIRDNPQADFFYTDEIIADALMRPTGSFCKPAFDSVLLSGCNYINHFSIFRRKKLEEIGCLRTDREGSQDYDLLLRYLTDVRAGHIVHIPFLAYMWRREERTYSSVFIERSVANARLSLQDAYERIGRSVAIDPAVMDRNLNRVRFKGDAPRPKVSVIIPNKDSLDLIKRVARDVLERTDYSDLELVITDNGSTDAAVIAFYDTLRRHPNVTIEITPEPFNFARMCNRGARLASGDALLFLNNDIEVQDRDWLTEMVECLSFEATGIVGAKLLYPNGLVQHNGVITGLGGAAGHWYIGEAADEPGPMGRLAVRQSIGAVTGACMLVKRGCFEFLKGFDEEKFAIAYNDIDLCLRARAAGYRTVWTPFAQLIHHESVSRGSDESGENNLRFRREFANLQERHGTDDYLDDAYSPFFDRRYSKPHLIIPEGLPALRPNVFP